MFSLHDFDQPQNAEFDSTRLKVSDFTIGWICALEREYIAALEVLDEEYGTTDNIANFLRAKGDRNTYTLGRIGKHKVVILCPEANTYGLVQAAGVAENMKRSFRCIRFILMVGVAGGAPSAKNDVRLGDVVIGTKVLPYGFGKETVEGFKVANDLKSAPQLLRSCGTQLKVHVARGLSIQEEIYKMARNSNVTDNRFRQPDQETDRLYHTGYSHSENCDCIENKLGQDEHIIQRPSRAEGCLIQVHLGTIASADQVMKNAQTRDRLASAHDILCFEMESAGLMGKFNCLPIRGICDYSDSHKNDYWHDYAAAAAAVCAKELLALVEPKQPLAIPAAQQVPDSMDTSLLDTFGEIGQAIEGPLKFIEQMDRLNRALAGNPKPGDQRPAGGCPIQ